MDSKRFMQILNSRITLTAAMVAAGSVLLRIQGNGTYVAKDEAKGVAFDKYIYNLKANSAISMSRQENKELLASALKAETAGDEEKAAALFNQYLNAVQISFNIPADRSTRFNNGDDVKAEVALVDTKAGLKQLVVNNVSYVAPKTVAATKFDITDLIAEPAAAAITDPEKVIS
jgi:hypothetical protein